MSFICTQHPVIKEHPIAVSIQSAGPGVSVAVTSGDGQYVISGSQTSLIVIRQQASGQQVVAYAFLNGTEASVHFQFPQEPTSANDAGARELMEALHAAHSIENGALPPEPDVLVKTMEQGLHQLLESLSV